MEKLRQKLGESAGGKKIEKRKKRKDMHRRGEKQRKKYGDKGRKKKILNIGKKYSQKNRM